LPYSQENVGNLQIQNLPKLVDNQKSRIDIILGEIKTGNTNNPNRTWRSQAEIETIKSAIQFIGAFNDEAQLIVVVDELVKNYILENDEFRIRYMLFAEKSNNHYEKLGVQYIEYDSIIDFFINPRGSSWKNNSTGLRSVHHQWDPLIKDIFAICNDQTLSDAIKKQVIKILMSSK
jgi:hypothetical protein